MEELESFIEKLIEHLLSPEELTYNLIDRKLSEFGIVLTNKQKKQLKDQLNQDAVENIQINLTWMQKRRFRNSKENVVVVDVGDETGPTIKDVQNVIDDVVQEVSERISKALLKNWKSQSPSILKKQNKERGRQFKAIYDIWNKPLDLLEILLSVSTQVGSEFNEYYRSGAVNENDFKFEALTELHARGCQVGLEALILLRNGLADGAHSRWRTLHEISVEALYISLNEKYISEKYLLHSVITSYRIASEYGKYWNDIGYAQPNQDDLDSLKNQQDELLDRFGKHFKHDYGWTTKNSSDKPPSFAKLEKLVGLEHMRPFYKLANINVHSGSYGGSFRLGLPTDNGDFLLVGPSIYGLGEPGQNIAFSSFLITSTLLLSRENLDQLTLVTTLEQLMNETIWAFDEVIEEQENS